MNIGPKRNSPVRIYGRERLSFCFESLSHAYFDSFGTFHSFVDLKSDLIAFFQAVEVNSVLKIVGMKKQIFAFSFASDETVSFVHQANDCTFFHYSIDYFL